MIFFKYASLNVIARILNFAALAIIAKVSEVNVFAIFTIFLVSTNSIISILGTGLVPSLIKSLVDLETTEEKVGKTIAYFLISLLLFFFIAFFISLYRNYYAYEFHHEKLFALVLIAAFILLLKSYAEALLLANDFTIIAGSSKVFESFFLLIFSLLMSVTLLSLSIYEVFILSQIAYFIPILIKLLPSLHKSVRINFSTITGLPKIARNLLFLSSSAIVAAPVLPYLTSVQLNQIGGQLAVANFGISNQFQAMSLFLPSLLSVFLTRHVMETGSNLRKVFKIQIYTAIMASLVTISCVLLLEPILDDYYSAYHGIENTIYIMLIASFFHNICNFSNNFIIKYKNLGLFLTMNVIWAGSAVFSYQVFASLDLNDAIALSLLVAYMTASACRLLILKDIFKINIHTPESYDT